MVAWMVALVPWRLLGTMEMCIPRELKMTPRRVALDLQNTMASFGTLLLCQLLLFQILPVPDFPLPGILCLFQPAFPLA